MSTVKELATALITKIEHLPKEKLRHSISFKESQYERLRKVTNAPKKYVITNKKPSVKEVIFKKIQGKDNFLDSEKDVEKFTTAQLKHMLGSLDNLTQDKFNKYYDVGDKLRKPAGYPNYYTRLMGEITGENKETWLSAFRTVVFGK